MLQILILILFLLPVSPASAQTFGLQVQPANTALQLSPGDSENVVYTLTNTTDETLVLSTQFFEFRPNEEDGSITPSSRPLTDTKPRLANYFTILQNNQQNQTITLQPHQTKTITLNIDIPANAVQEDTYTSLTFSAQNDVEEGSSIVGVIGSNILLTVGNSTPELSINEFRSQGSIFDNSRQFSLSVKNTGRNYTTTQATISIYNMFGGKVAELTTDPATILSESTRHLTVNGQPSINWNKNFLFGRYTATVTLSPQQNVQKSIFFTSFPLIPIIVFIISLLFITGIYLRVKRKI